ncbi:hypothetical protein [Gleimia coleocanis]|uniref:hypothetical protein n=1 Tax=Gleimia coleocanis TaxID=103618 RepID=UPI0003028C2D|nr:hypothetical protein [Gleimia coleocanis]
MEAKFRKILGALYPETATEKWLIAIGFVLLPNAYIEGSGTYPFYGSETILIAISVTSILAPFVFLLVANYVSELKTKIYLTQFGFGLVDGLFIGQLVTMFLLGTYGVVMFLLFCVALYCYLKLAQRVLSEARQA